MKLRTPHHLWQVKVVLKRIFLFHCGKLCGGTLLFLELKFSNKALQSKYYVQESKYMEMSDNAFSVCVRLHVHASLPVEGCGCVSLSDAEQAKHMVCLLFVTSALSSQLCQICCQTPADQLLRWSVSNTHTSYCRFNFEWIRMTFKSTLNFFNIKKPPKTGPFHLHKHSNP